MQLYVPLRLPFNKTEPLKTRLLTILLALFSFLPFAYSQNYYPRASPQPTGMHPVIGKQANDSGGDSLYTFINYYLSEASLSASYVGGQRQLINSAYSYPTDTSNLC